MSSEHGQSVGVFTTDRGLVVRSWDPWIAGVTGVTETDAVGRKIHELFPDLAERGLVARFERVARGDAVEVLAPAFHKYLIPCPPRDPASAFDRMRQHATLAPLRTEAGVVGIVVTIQDVTPRLERERELAQQLASHDAAVRLRATQLLAEHDAPPPLIASALADSNWRVRRAAAGGMAQSGSQEAMSILIEALRERHEDPAILNAALTALAQREENDVVRAVASLLASDDANVRIYAALGLGMLKEPRAVPALLDRLTDDDVNVRFHAIEALGRIGDASAAPALAAVAESRDFFLSFAALDAIALVGDASVAQRVIPLLADKGLLPAAAACLGSLGAEDAVIPLTETLTRPGAPVSTIASAIVRVHDKVELDYAEGDVVTDLVRHSATPSTVEALVRAIAGATDDDLRAIVRVLGWLPHDGIDAAIAPLLTHETTRETVAGVLSTRGARAVGVLLDVARRSDDAANVAAAMALGRIGRPQAVEGLIEMLGGTPDVVVAAAGALGAIGDRRAFEPLLPLMGHADASVRQAVVSALNSVGHPDMNAAIAERIADPSPRVRESAVRIAGYFGYPDCLDAMIARCRDADELVRRAAVEHLASHEDPRAVTAILEALASDAAQAVRAGAARALGTVSDDRALDGLLAATRDDALWVRYYAVRSLAQRSAGDLRALERLMASATADPAPPVRIAAIEGLGGIGATAALPFLEAMTEDPEPDIATAAIAALGRFGPGQTSIALQRALASKTHRLRVAALDAIGTQRDAGAVEAVLGVAQGADPELRVAAVRALSRIGSREALDALARLAADRRGRAAMVLARAAAREPARAVLSQTLAAAR